MPKTKLVSWNNDLVSFTNVPSVDLERFLDCARWLKIAKIWQSKQSTYVLPEYHEKYQIITTETGS